MLNLVSAKAAIEAEIAHAKEGVAHFYARVEALEKALFHIVAVDGGVLDAQPVAAAPVAKPTGKAAKSAKPAVKAEKAAATAKPVKAAKQTKGGSELPSIGGDYWPDLLTAEPKSSLEVLDAAVVKLGFTPTKEQRQKLAGRMTFALNALVKAGRIQDFGKGRDRRFFKG